MPNAPKRPRDLNEWAKRMVDIATGEVSDIEPTPARQRSIRRQSGATRGDERREGQS